MTILQSGEAVFWLIAPTLMIAAVTLAMLALNEVLRFANWLYWRFHRSH